MEKKYLKIKKYLHYQSNEYLNVVDSTCQLFDGKKNYTSRY